MLITVKYASDRKRYTQQNNNAIENIMKKFETCGPSAAVNCIDSVCKEITDVVKECQGVAQPEDFLTIVMNNIPLYREEMLQARPGLDPSQYPANEIPQYYPMFIKKLWGDKVKAVFAYFDGDKMAHIQSMIKDGQSVQACLINPGHFICVKGIDLEAGYLLCNDPYNGRNGVDGFSRVITVQEVNNNFQPWYISYKAEI